MHVPKKDVMLVVLTITFTFCCIFFTLWIVWYVHRIPQYQPVKKVRQSRLSPDTAEPDAKNYKCNFYPCWFVVTHIATSLTKCICHSCRLRASAFYFQNTKLFKYYIGTFNSKRYFF